MVIKSLQEENNVTLKPKPNERGNLLNVKAAVFFKLNQFESG